MSQPSEQEIAQFSGNVKRMVTLQDKLKEIAAQGREARAPIKEQFDEVQQEIIQFMKNSEINICNYQEEKIELQAVTRYGSLTRKSLMKGLVSYFNETDEQHPQSTAVFDHIIDSLGYRELDILKRIKKRKTKAKGGKRNNTAAEDTTAPNIDDEDSD